jgi:integrase
MKLPKVQRTEMHFLDAEQVEALAEAIDHRYATLIRFVAYSGLRPSELTALRVGRLNLLRGSARVVEAAPEIDGRLHWGGVKTHESRTVRLPRSISEELAADLAGRPRDPEALVFTAPLGGPLRRTHGSRVSLSLRSARPVCPRRCGCTAFGTPARHC